jgi:hypothetical protein
MIEINLQVGSDRQRRKVLFECKQPSDKEKKTGPYGPWKPDPVIIIWSCAPPSKPQLDEFLERSIEDSQSLERCLAQGCGVIAVAVLRPNASFPRSELRDSAFSTSSTSPSTFPPSLPSPLPEIITTPIDNPPSWLMTTP